MFLKKVVFPKNVVSTALNYYIQQKSTILPGIFLRRDQVNLLVYGPNQPYFEQKQKNITKFWPSGVFLLLFLFSAF